MKKRLHLGIQFKLIIAFLCVSLIPVCLIIYLVSQQERLLREKTTHLQQQNQAIAESLRAHSAQYSDIKDALLSWSQEKLPPEHQGEIAAFIQSVDKRFAARHKELEEATNRLHGDSQGTLEEIDTLLRERQVLFIGLILAVTVCASIAAFLLGKFLTDPMIRLTQIAQKISQGEIHDHVQIRAKDEVGQLYDAFTSMIMYLQHIATIANRFSNGNIQTPITPKSPKDALGNALYMMGQYFNNIAQIACQVSKGKLLERFSVISSEDVLGNAFKMMVANLASILCQIKVEVQTIELAGENAVKRSQQEIKMVEDVLSSAEETSSSMMEMQASVEEVSENMSALSVSIEGSVTSIEQMNMSIKQIASNTVGLSNSANETFGVVQNIGETIKQLVSTARQVESFSQEASASADAGQESVREIITGMETIQQVVSSSADAIKSLEERSKEIGSITDVISDIADQTSLLALNASIIAAQAGEHGRGFAVVAQEVKELAQRSLSAAKEIGGIVKRVQTESRKAGQSMEKGLESVENGVVLAHRGGKALEAIRRSVHKAIDHIAENTKIAHEQAQLSDQVGSYMENVIKLVEEIVRATTEQQKGSAQVTEAVERMSNLAEQVKRATTEQTRGTNHVLEAMENVTMQVQESSARAHEVAKFSANLVQRTGILMELLNRFDLGSQDEKAIVPQPTRQIVESHVHTVEVLRK